MTSSNVAPKKRIAVIGMGHSGLCTMKQLREHQDKFTVVGFERAAEIGGQWFYTEETGTDKYGLPVFSSMYDDLMINVPSSFMEIPGFPHRSQEDSYLNRQQIFNYLQNFADTYDLRKNVKFHTFITKVQPLSDTVDTQWEVTYCDVRNQTQMNTETFDSVVVCHGHNDKPYIPDIKGLERFEGNVLHSHDYRKSSTFKGQKVVLLGASYSGLDLAMQISQVADTVFLSHCHGPLKSQMPDNVDERPGIKMMTDKTVIFEDGTEEEVDSLIFCTGFLYNMTFLEDVITVQNEHVTPVFCNVVHIEHNTLLFVGMAKVSAYFAQNYETSRFVVRCLLGLVPLPSKEEMYDYEEKDIDYRMERGLRPHTYNTEELEWKFNEDLAKFGGMEPITTFKKKIWKVAKNKRTTNFMHFREYNYKIMGPDTFSVEHSSNTGSAEIH